VSWTDTAELNKPERDALIEFVRAALKADQPRGTRMSSNTRRQLESALGKLERVR
jgi:hypothetical protein